MWNGREGVRTSVLSRALLGLLAAEPMSGYGLARLFERTLARAWPARHPQIYPALAELERQGLLRVDETGPRRRKTYAVTEEGIAEALSGETARGFPGTVIASRGGCRTATRGCVISGPRGAEVVDRESSSGARSARYAARSSFPSW